jgi:[acyl-carrier-protein] S-malonyltransferase
MKEYRIAFLFPGQGSQHVGMGRGFYDSFESVRIRFEEASEILGYDLASLCFEGPEEKLKLTVHTQPAIFTVSAAVCEVLESEGFVPAAAAGHSLGEYSALVGSRAIEFSSALSAVKRRAELMYEEGSKRPGTMAAVLESDISKVESLCDKASSAGVCQIANINSPGQFVISGDVSAVEKAAEISSELGIRRVMMLKVSGAFHSDLMSPASQRLRQKLEELDISDPRAMFVPNATGQRTARPEEIRTCLIKQLDSPVLWQKSMETLLAEELASFVEVGPGKVLSGLMKKIDRDTHCFTTETPEAMDETLKAITAGTNRVS